MDKTIQNEFKPNYASPPGETLQDTLDILGITPAELAQQMGESIKVVNEIIEGKAPITPDIAWRLECAVDVPADFWNNRERYYREAKRRLAKQEPLEKHISWSKKFPMEELIRLEWIEDWRDIPTEQVREMLYFFDLGSPKEWPKQWNHAPLAMFLKSSVAPSNPYALAAWLRKGELDAEEIECSPYNQEKFRAALLLIRALTTQPPELFLEPLVQHCAQAGVAVVFVPALSQISVSGATRWLTPDKALIQLTLDYKSDEHLWFSFYHEAGHIMHPSPDKQEILLEHEGKNEQQLEKEEQANQFAADMLIPSEAYQQFVKKGPTSASICRFAEQIGIAPGIVVGRLQHDGYLPLSQCNELKQIWRLAKE